MKWPILTIPVLAAVLAPETSAQQRKEFGTIQWQRDFDAALKANKAGKPVFALFQEVPG